VVVTDFAAAKNYFSPAWQFRAADFALVVGRRLNSERLPKNRHPPSK
jgi:hypothetical protein